MYFCWLRLEGDASGLSIFMLHGIRLDILIYSSTYCPKIR